VEAAAVAVAVVEAAAVAAISIMKTIFLYLNHRPY
jgi:hypothetical protein